MPLCMNYKTAFYLIFVYNPSSLSQMLNYTSQSEIKCQQNAANNACELTPNAIDSVNTGYVGMPLECSKIGEVLFWKLLTAWASG